MARLQWLEAILPLGIIGGMLCIMGNGQYYIHKAAHGRVCGSSSSSYPSLPPPPDAGPSRADDLASCVGWMQPKHIGNDMWDVAMERRDKKLMDQSSGI
ncbi:hypothetical protein ABZP36_028404 [Zizania latifolia]